MAVKLITPVMKEFVLEKTDATLGDGNSKTTARFRQARQGDVESMEELFAGVEQQLNQDGSIGLKGRFSRAFIKKKQVFLTLCYTDLLDESGGPLFKFENDAVKSEVDFGFAWAKLPPIIANELHELCIMANPQWGDSGEG